MTLMGLINTDLILERQPEKYLAEPQPKLTTKDTQATQRKPKSNHRGHGVNTEVEEMIWGTATKAKNLAKKIKFFISVLTDGIYAGTILMLKSTAEAEWVRAPTEI